MTEREAFEAWAREYGYDIDEPYDPAHADAWLGWNARAARAQPAQAGQVLIADEICDAWEFITGHQIQFGPSTEGRPMYLCTDEIIEFARAIESAVLAKRAPQWTATADQMPPPDAWLLVTWDGGRVDKAHTFNKWEHPTNPLGYLIQGHPGAHADVTHWMPLPPPPIVGKEGA